MSCHFGNPFNNAEMVLCNPFMQHLRCNSLEALGEPAQVSRHV